jgi:hypothetical protein
VPPAWGQDLHGLPGFDQESGVVRLTDDPERMRDSSGRPLMYPGRSHPLTRRAIASVRTGRVSAARGRKRSLLITYAVEVGSLLRTVFALLVPSDGAVKEQADFLSCANDPVLADGLWQKKFASRGAKSARGGWCARGRARRTDRFRRRYRPSGPSRPGGRRRACLAGAACKRTLWTDRGSDGRFVLPRTDGN